MKTRLAILAVLAATAGISTGATAATPDEMLAPVAPVVDPLATKPSLFPSEQGAFKALEVASQIVEASIEQNGCDTAEYDLKVATKANGAGTLTLDGVTLKIDGSVPNPHGRLYKITGAGSLVTPVPGVTLTVANLVATGSYNIGSGIQEVTTDFDLGSQNEGLDHFRGTVIKDYAKLPGYYVVPAGFKDAGKKVGTVIDYGYQQIQKNYYVAAKYWQQSQAWRQNNALSGTWWTKTRVAPDGDCQIVVKLDGNANVGNRANAQALSQVGSISVNVAEPIGVPGWDYAK